MPLSPRSFPPKLPYIGKPKSSTEEKRGLGDKNDSCLHGLESEGIPVKISMSKKQELQLIDKNQDEMLDDLYCIAN